MTRHIGNPRHIAIFRAGALGDLLCATPAWRALRQALPEAAIDLISLPWAKAFTPLYPHLIRQCIEFPGYPGLPEQAHQPSIVVDFLRRLQHHQYDLILQMHGSGIITNPLVELMGARQTAGWYLPGHYCPDPQTFSPYPDNISEVHRHIRLLQTLGVPSQGDHLEPPHMAPGLSGHLRPRQYAVIHPGAVSSTPWPPEHFASLARHLAAQGMPIVLTGTASERPLVQAVQRALAVPAYDLCGQTDLATLARLVHDARILISNDTGVAHLAAATATPSLVIFTTADPARWAPLDHQLHHSLIPPHTDPTHAISAIDQLLKIN